METGIITPPFGTACGVPQKHETLFGISFGYPDDAAPANSFSTTHAPLEETVTFHT